MMPSLQKALEHAFALWKGGKPNEAAKVFEIILQQEPFNSVAYYGLGSIALDNGAIATARSLLERSVQLDPSADWSWHNLGVAHRMSQDYEKALNCFQRALNLNPDSADLLAMVAGMHVNAGKPEKAVEWSDRALKIDHENAHAWNHKAHGHLELGEWAEGWDAWARRWENPERAPMKRDYGCPEWTGGEVEGTIVLHGEQGLGDEILFMTCFNDFKKEIGDARIVIECAKRLVPLFRRSFNVPCYGTEEDVKAHEKPDYWVAMGSLPAMYRRSDLAFRKQPKKTLKPDPDRVKHWKGIVGNATGIAWWGGLAKTHSKVRVAPIDLWQNLVKDGNFVSVQYETGDTVNEAKKIGVPHYVEAVADFDDHTALIAACDKIITVCQTAHHQAGALGKECWTLVPSAPAWRYGFEERNVWYPSVTQFCQKGDDWEAVFDEVLTELKQRKAA